MQLLLLFLELIRGSEHQSVPLEEIQRWKTLSLHLRSFKTGMNRCSWFIVRPLIHLRLLNEDVGVRGPLPGEAGRVSDLGQVLVEVYDTLRDRARRWLP